MGGGGSGEVACQGRRPQWKGRSYGWRLEAPAVEGEVGCRDSQQDRLLNPPCRIGHEPLEPSILDLELKVSRERSLSVLCRLLLRKLLVSHCCATSVYVQKFHGQVAGSCRKFGSKVMLQYI